MEEMMKLQRTCGSNRVNHIHQPALCMHKDSHVISKFKPKIRIVHIFAPEIIKTDVANFRELVQRLTGKPSSSSDRKASKKKGAAIIRTSTSTHDHHDQVSSSSRSGTSTSSNYKFSNQLQPKMISTTDQSSSDGFQSSGPNSGYGYGGDGIKEEEEEVIWGGENSSANNLFGIGFNDFEGFIQGLNHEYPFLPLMNNSSTHLDMMLGEPFLT